MPPMGDIRNCIAALADAEPAMTRLLQYRFPVRTSPVADPAKSPAGHAFGNLLIAALTDITGDFEEGVRQSNRVLAVRGKVVPVARPADDAPRRARRRYRRRGPVAHRSSARHPPACGSRPTDVRAGCRSGGGDRRCRDGRASGPGSLYTSLLPPLLVPGIRAALASTGAPRLFVCNVATQVGETEGYTLSDHLAALARARHRRRSSTRCWSTATRRPAQPANYPAAPVRMDVPLSGATGPQILTRDVVDDDNAHRHDPRKLAARLHHDELPRRRGVVRRQRHDARSALMEARSRRRALRRSWRRSSRRARCCRVAERAGLGAAARGRARTPAIGPAGRAARGQLPAATHSTGSRRRATAGWHICAAASWRTARLSLTADRNSPRTGRAILRAWCHGCAGRGTGLSGRFAAAARPWRPDLEELGAHHQPAATAWLRQRPRWRSRHDSWAAELHGHLNRVVNAESANLRRAVEAAASPADEHRGAGTKRRPQAPVRAGAACRGAPGAEHRRPRSASLPPPGSVARAGAARFLRARKCGAPPRRCRVTNGRASRPVIIAANWKMNTTPLDAALLANDIAAATEVPASRA